MMIPHRALFKKSRILLVGLYLAVSMIMGMGVGLVGRQKVHAAPLPTVTTFAASNCNYKKTLFGLPVWYEYLQQYERPSDPNNPLDGCSFDFSSQTPTGADAGICTQAHAKQNTCTSDLKAFVLIGLAIADILLRLAGVIAVIFVVIGGFRYVIGQGEPDNIKSAQSTIVNALIGLAIALVANGVVQFVGTKLGGG